MWINQNQSILVTYSQHQLVVYFFTRDGVIKMRYFASLRNKKMKCFDYLNPSALYKGKWCRHIMYKKSKIVLRSLLIKMCKYWLIDTNSYTNAYIISTEICCKSWCTFVSQIKIFSNFYLQYFRIESFTAIFFLLPILWLLKFIIFEVCT